MKYIIPLFAFLIVCFHSYGSTIDSIKTKEDVIKFLATKLDKEYGYNQLFREENVVFKIDPSRPAKNIDFEKRMFKREYRSNSFYKADINNDGRTDLIVDAFKSFIVMDMGDMYEMHHIDQWDYSPYYFFKSTIILPDQSTALLFLHDTAEYRYSEIILKTDTLVYKFNGFVEYNSHPVFQNINRFYFNKQSTCCGDCSYFQANKNGMALCGWFGGRNDSGGIFLSSIDRSKLAELWSLLAYLNVKALSDGYTISASDVAIATSETCFEDESIKKIVDYGFSGTIGLATLYQKISELIKFQSWQPWYNSPPALDSYLLVCGVPFTEGNYFCYHPYFVDDIEDNSNKLGQTFVSERGYCGQKTSCVITLFLDHHFVYKQQLGKCEGRGTAERNLLALGTWTNTTDSTIVLNWDGLLTLKTARNKEECKKYFSSNSVPLPLKIENWSFTYTSDKKMLKPSFHAH